MARLRAFASGEFPCHKSAESVGVSCGFIYADKTVCAELEDNPIHDKNGGYAGFHPFQLGASPAPARSPANGGAEPAIRNLEASAVSAGAAEEGDSYPWRRRVGC